MKLSPKAQELVKPELSLEQNLKALEKAKLGNDSVDLLAHSMPEPKAVEWACKSSDVVQEHLAPEDIQAKLAAEKWLQDPTPINQKAAADAAMNTKFQSPGAWAAQSAAWAKETPVAARTGLGSEAAPAGLMPEIPPELAAQQSAGTAASNSVKMAAAMKADPDYYAALDQMQPPPVEEITEMPEPAPPQELSPDDESKAYKSLKPFIKMGKKIAAS